MFQQLLDLHTLIWKTGLESSTYCLLGQGMPTCAASSFGLKVEGKNIQLIKMNPLPAKLLNQFLHKL